MVAARVVVLQRPGVEVDLARGEEEEDDDDELQDEDVSEAHADGEAVGLRVGGGLFEIQGGMAGLYTGN